MKRIVKPSSGSPWKTKAVANGGDEYILQPGRLEILRSVVAIVGWPSVCATLVLLAVWLEHRLTALEYGQSANAIRIESVAKQGDELGRQGVEILERLGRVEDKRR